MSFKIDDDYSVLIKYNEIWNKIKDLLHITFHSKPLYDGKYIKDKAKTFNSTVNTVFCNEKISKKMRITFA